MKRTSTREWLRCSRHSLRALRKARHKASTRSRTRSISQSTKGETMKLPETIGRHKLLSLFIALVFALTLYPNKAQAQIVGDLEVNIPFQFHAGNVKLPAGKYVIRMLDDSNLTIMEISNADG